MPATDARSGFRLPWNSDQPASDERADGTRAAGANTTSEAVDTSTLPSGATMPATTPSAAPQSGPRRPSKFLADLTRAMQTAAEAAREESTGRLQADAKAYVEEIHARSATEAADLRRQADDDVAAIREWSKAEIARIREETESRITTRKGRLETEIDDHAALVERQIEQVQRRVAAFEQEMATFFERLLAEDDPTRFASLAEKLPEPPPFDGDLPAFAAAAVPAADERTGFLDDDDSMAAIQAAAETAAAEEDEADDSRDLAGDGRLSALGFATDFDAAEAEAFAAAGSADDLDIPTIGDEALAARLEGLVPVDESPAPAGTSSTRVVVTGLVSVASIASFKRHLGRLAGVQSVGVTSGPDGEFVFTVAHAASVKLGDAIPALPGFKAQVTGGSADTVEVTAVDPENEA